MIFVPKLEDTAGTTKSTFKVTPGCLKDQTKHVKIDPMNEPSAMNAKPKNHKLLSSLKQTGPPRPTNGH
jgi:hypothetical protein